jgi:hypothetical protein
MFFLLLPSKERTKEKSPRMKNFSFFSHTALRHRGQKASVSHHPWTACAHFIPVELLNY